MNGPRRHANGGFASGTFADLVGGTASVSAAPEGAPRPVVRRTRDARPVDRAGRRHPCRHGPRRHAVRRRAARPADVRPGRGGPSRAPVRRPPARALRLRRLRSAAVRRPPGHARPGAVPARHPRGAVRPARPLRHRRHGPPGVGLGRARLRELSRRGARGRTHRPARLAHRPPHPRHRGRRAVDRGRLDHRLRHPVAPHCQCPPRRGRRCRRLRPCRLGRGAPPATRHGSPGAGSEPPSP